MKRKNKIIAQICTVAALIVLGADSVRAANPIVPNRGLNDPHIHIFGDRAYVYASHDRSMTNKTFVMDDWWVWSSPDLVHWTNECVIQPEQTFIGKAFSGCWAVDAASRNGKYYFYFSQKNEQTGVMVGDSPAGPWRDPLGKPLLPAGIVPTHAYDNCVFQDDDGKPYIIFGVWDYYIARLNEDMISLAEQPRLLELDRKFGPYGEGKTDDKPNLHKANGHYYLTWGCFYAMADNVYGPYTFKGSVMDTNSSFAPGYASPTWPKGPLQGRHGNFFTWHNQWYYTYGDISQTGNRFFRDAFISYLHYKANGEIAPIRVDGIGVGEYRAPGKIEAEDFFAATNMVKQEITNGFAVSATKAGGYLIFPNVHGLTNCTQITLQFAAGSAAGRIEIHEQGAEGPLLAECQVEQSQQAAETQSVTVNFKHRPSGETLCLKFQESPSPLLDAITLSVPATLSAPLFTQTGSDPSFQEILKSGALPKGKNSQTGVTGSKINVNLPLVELTPEARRPFDTNIMIHTLGNSAIPRADFGKWSRWYQEEGHTQIFRLFEGEVNLRNTRPKAARIEAFSKLSWERGPWHEWSGTYTIIKPHGAAIFQVKNNVNDWAVQLDMNATGDVILNPRRGTAKVIATNMVDKPFNVRVRDNGQDYEVYLNGDKVGEGAYARPTGKTAFRWGMYLGEHDVRHEAMIFVSGATVDTVDGK